MRTGKLVVGWNIMKVVLLEHFSNMNDACKPKISFQLVKGFLTILLIVSNDKLYCEHWNENKLGANVVYKSCLIGDFWFVTEMLEWILVQFKKLFNWKELVSYLIVCFPFVIFRSWWIGSTFDEFGYKIPNLFLITYQSTKQCSEYYLKIEWDEASHHRSNEFRYIHINKSASPINQSNKFQNAYSKSTKHLEIGNFSNIRRNVRTVKSYGIKYFGHVEFQLCWINITLVLTNHIF